MTAEEGAREERRPIPAHERADFPAYVEELVGALLERDGRSIHRLLAHPLARGLPRLVREEAIGAARTPHSLRAPVQTLWFHHRIAQLHGRAASRAAPARSRAEASDDEPWGCADAPLDDRDVAEDGSAAEPDPDQLELFRLGEAPWSR